jgi:hypothetical protein
VSAFLVGKRSIDAIVLVRERMNRDSDVLPALEHLSNDELGRMLWRENMLSLGARYSDPLDEEALAGYRYAFTSALLAAPVVALIKNIHCYRYQSCEHDGWEKSDAAALCEALESYLVHRLPGYSDAPWGLDCKDEPAPPAPPPANDARKHHDVRGASPDARDRYVELAEGERRPVLTPSTCTPLAPFPKASR